MRQPNTNIKNKYHIQNEKIIRKKEVLLPHLSNKKPQIKKLLLLLLSPLLIGIITFFAGMIIMATGSASHSSFIMLTAQISLLIATLTYIYGPAYILGLVIYILLVKKFNIEKYKALWIIPCIQALFSWYPSFIRVAVENRTLLSFLGVTVSAFLISLIWIGGIVSYHKFVINRTMRAKAK